ncbi:unnamed protein product [Anisakis simplex]|uniref:ULP_PROTEASE domain-containing protein n=1 Tax=Anisakis simplex TaxID=6269 RepID=A0A0M3K596_ANISI|nr:unnamed protein product [Anisakis simplex]
MLTRQAAQRKVIHMIDEDDGVDALQKKDVDLSQGNLLVYPVGEKDAVPIHFADVECLKPEQMLNDVIIDFFLKHIHYESIPLERRSSVFVFNSFFYGKLSNCNGGIPPHSAVARSKWIMSNYKSVRNWTKNVDLFSKEYIVVPINEDIHWYLAIIVHPSAAIEVPNAIEANDESQKKRRRKTYIIWNLFCRKLTAAVLREYLECEYNDKRKQKAVDGERFAKELVEKITPRELPQQRNYTDCGLFLLKYAECFLVNPPQLITQSDSFLRWYPRFTIKNMRSAILDKVKSLCDPQKWSAYEEYSKGRECDVQTTQHTIEPFSTETTMGISVVLPFRSDSPKPRLRSYSTGDEQEEVTTEMKRPLTP